MTQTTTIHDFLRRAFAPTRQGVVGLAEQLLRVGASLGGSTEFVRAGDRCVCRWTLDGDTQEAPVPIPPAAFRALLAQIAVLCGAPPHGGEATVTNDSAVLHVALVNTAENQQLKLKSAVSETLVAANPPRPAEACGAPLPTPTRP